MLKKADLRIIRTEKFIYDAFIKLIAEKGYDAITIQDITDEVLINRATFHSHYRDKEANLNFRLASFYNIKLSLIQLLFHVS
ncbi:hypothetical protein Bmyc01_60320 [Bacillus mycoides]|nr:hypothetical protein Bmyc01_60320 [Bacillus mycoides]